MPGSGALGASEREKFPDVLPVLGKYLKDPLPRIKTTAIKLLQCEDPVQAVSAVMALLHSSHRPDRESAINCLFYFDFSLVRNGVFEALTGEHGDELLVSGLLLFETNPEPENLFLLYSLEKQTVSPEYKRIAATRKRCVEHLIRFGRLTTEQVVVQEADFEGRVRREHSKALAAPAAYAAKVVRPAKIESVQDAPDIPLGEQIADGVVRILANRRTWLALGLMLAVGLAVMVINYSGKAGLGISKGKALLLAPVQVKGKINQINPVTNRVRLVANDGPKVLQIPAGGTLTLLVSSVAHVRSSGLRIDLGTVEASIPSRELSVLLELPGGFLEANNADFVLRVYPETGVQLTVRRGTVKLVGPAGPVLISAGQTGRIHLLASGTSQFPTTALPDPNAGPQN